MMNKMTTSKATFLLAILQKIKSLIHLGNPKPVITTTIILSCLLISACKQKPKTYWERQEELMEGKSDERLIEELYGNPINYKVEYVIRPEGFNYEKSDALPINTNAVLQVMFNKNKVYIEKIGTLLGSYQKQYYSDDSGFITVDFDSRTPGPMGVAHMWGGGSRINPQFHSEFINIIQILPGQPDNWGLKPKMRYILKRLDN